MRTASLHDELAAVEKRLKHCELFITQQRKIIDNVVNRPDIVQLASRNLEATLQVRWHRQAERERILRELKAAS
jgi:hypothetical protein